MSTRTEDVERANDQVRLRRPAAIVSADAHVGPLLETQLRQYCPEAYLEEFDRFVQAERAIRSGPSQQLGFVEAAAQQRNLTTPGHHDPDARLRDLDYDGVAAEVLFHGSQNGETIPFMSLGSLPSGNPLIGVSFDDLTERKFELFAIGQRIYNRWLADFVSVAPERFVGLAHVPIWDVKEAAAEVRWARQHGLRGVNFPSQRPGLPNYGDAAWDPFWQSCVETDLPLAMHAGAGDPSTWTGPQAAAILCLESGGWFSRRALHFMIFGGVFERYPTLRLVLTEQPGTWWPYTAMEYDSVWKQYAADSELRRQVPEAPSTYMMRNVFVGASFMSPMEAHDALEHGYSSQVLWGTDYPHSEGTFQVPESENEPSQTKLALRDAFGGCDPLAAAQMAGGTATKVYGLDAKKLAEVAQQIGAPTPLDIVEPLTEIPERHGFLTFRRNGPFS